MQTGRILLIDNEVGLCRMMEAVLRDQDHQVKTFTNPVQAVAEFSAGDYDLVITDIKMPEMNGYDAFDEIRKMNKKIPIIAQTAYAMENDRKTILDYGFNAFSKQKIAVKGDQIQNIPIVESEDKVAVGEIAKDLYVMVKKGQEKEISQEVEVKDSLTAPIAKGELLGNLTVYNGEEVISTVNVVAAEDIERANIIVRLWRKIFN